MFVLFSAIAFVLFLIVKTKFIPSFENEALGAVFSVLTYLVVFQHTEGLVDAAFTTDIFLFQVYLIIIVILFCKDTLNIRNYQMFKAFFSNSYLTLE